MPAIKNSHTKYGEFPPKVVETKPCHKICVDLEGMYKVQILGGVVHSNLHALTMVDPTKSWFEIVEIPNKTSEPIVLLVD